MSTDDTKGALPKGPKKYQHFKLVSEGGTHLAKSPDGGRCLNTIEVLRGCTTEGRIREYRATTGNCT
jgi:hypothetical protein